MSDLKIPLPITSRTQFIDMRSMLGDLNTEVDLLNIIVEDKDKCSGSVAASANCLKFVDDITETNAHKNIQEIREKLNVIIPDLDFCEGLSHALDDPRI